MLIIGEIRIYSMSGGVVNFGDSLYIAPENISISRFGDGAVDGSQATSPALNTGTGQAVTDPNIT
ncbi:spore germination protein [Halobacillus sp. H74]|uniref:spore germination protein n=1 Tax=Halobacillus sp. H74 TaxID=3457436 RepID=UPI003FCD6600